MELDEYTCWTTPRRGLLLVDPEDFSRDGDEPLDEQFPFGMMSHTEEPCGDTICVERTGMPVVIGVEDFIPILHDDAVDVPKELKGSKLVAVNGVSFEFYLRSEAMFGPLPLEFGSEAPVIPLDSMVTTADEDLDFDDWESDANASMPRCDDEVDIDWDDPIWDPVVDFASDGSTRYEELDMLKPPGTTRQEKLPQWDKSQEEERKERERFDRRKNSMRRKIDHHKGPGRRKARADARNIKCDAEIDHRFASGIIISNPAELAETMIEAGLRFEFGPIDEMIEEMHLVAA